MVGILLSGSQKQKWAFIKNNEFIVSTLIKIYVALGFFLPMTGLTD